MNGKYKWLNERTFLSVDQLRLWPENPRLNPEENHPTLAHFVGDLTKNPADKKDFYSLVKSIVEDGFIPADPVVVWKNEDNKKYYVAEGNRRITVLKLLKEPDKAPKSIRDFISGESKKIDLTTINEIPVSIAPNFDETEWYINQRNSLSSLQRKWTRVEQQCWIAKLYDKYNGDLDKILSITKLAKSELELVIRVLKIKDFVKVPEVKDKLTSTEFERANSYKFPITILERIFGFLEVREKWGVKYNGMDVDVVSNKSSFYNLFSELIKRIVNKSDDRINTRIDKKNLRNLFESLPKVTFDLESSDLGNSESSSNNVENPTEHKKREEDVCLNQRSDQKKTLKDSSSRNKIVLEKYRLDTNNDRLLGLFEELKHIPISKYPHHISSSFRVFLDLAVLEYTKTNKLEESLAEKYQCGFEKVTLKKRLEYIKGNKANKEVKKK